MDTKWGLGGKKKKKITFSLWNVSNYGQLPRQELVLMYYANRPQSQRWFSCVLSLAPPYLIPSGDVDFTFMCNSVLNIKGNLLHRSEGLKAVGWRGGFLIRLLLLNVRYQFENQILLQDIELELIQSTWFNSDSWHAHKYRPMQSQKKKREKRLFWAEMLIWNRWSDILNIDVLSDGLLRSRRSGWGWYWFRFQKQSTILCVYCKLIVMYSHPHPLLIIWNWGLILLDFRVPHWYFAMMKKS